MNVSSCQGCHATIIWGKSPAGAPMPYDARPITQNDPRVTARAVIYKLAPPDGQGTKYGTGATLGMVQLERDGPLYLSHFVTCPKAGDFSKARRR